MSTESILAYHCGPALTGIKPSNIASINKDENPRLKQELFRLNEILNKKDIVIYTLCECEHNILVMVYRNDKLCEYLRRDEILSLLHRYGYPSIFSLKDYLKILSDKIKYQRMGKCTFPHEIGAFLGYPYHDIEGFINHDNCLKVGEWKVYRNVDDAERLFHRYRQCRCALLKRINTGKTIADLFCTA